MYIGPVPTRLDASVDVALASDLVTQAARLVRTMRRRQQLPAGVRVLSVLDDLGPLTVTQLATAYSCSQPTMTGLVIRMENDGLVQRQPDPKDGRASLVSLTGEGKEAIEAYRQRAIASLAGGIDSFSAEERQVMAQAVPLLQRLNGQVAAQLDTHGQQA